MTVAREVPSICGQMIRLGITARQRDYWLRAGILRPIDTGQPSRMYRFGWDIGDLHDAIVTARLVDVIFGRHHRGGRSTNDLADLLACWRRLGRPTGCWLGYADGQAAIFATTEALAAVIRSGTVALAVRTDPPKEITDDYP